MFYRTPQKLPVFLTRAEAEALLRQPNRKAPTGLRNYCMLLLQLNTGLRASEIIGRDEDQKPLKNGTRPPKGLRLSDIDLTTGQITVRNGKGGKDRVVYLAPELTRFIAEWLKIRPEGKTDLLFTTLKGEKIKATYYRALIRRLAKKAGITKQVGTHTLRHTFAKHFLDRTGNVVLLQKILGHSSIQTTLIYTHLSNADVKKAMLGNAIV